ncbi:MAG: hypothetical protein P8175_16855, partial [Deltaproteobacteria bacterium]
LNKTQNESQFDISPKEASGLVEPPPQAKPFRFQTSRQMGVAGRAHGSEYAQMSNDSNLRWKPSRCRHRAFVPVIHTLNCKNIFQLQKSFTRERWTDASQFAY